MLPSQRTHRRVFSRSLLEHHSCALRGVIGRSNDKTPSGGRNLHVKKDTKQGIAKRDRKRERPNMRGERHMQDSAESSKAFGRTATTKIRPAWKASEPNFAQERCVLMWAVCACNCMLVRFILVFRRIHIKRTNRNMFDMWRVRSWNSTSGHYNKMLWKVLMTESQSHTHVFLTVPNKRMRNHHT